MTQERPRHRPSVFLREMGDSGSSDGMVEKRWDEEPSRTEAVRSATDSCRVGDCLLAERNALGILQKVRRLSPADEEGFARSLEALQAVAHAARARGEPKRSWLPQQPLPVGEKFSYTQLDAYRTCPLKYLYAYVYRIPVCPTPQMSFGSDLHECLEKLFQQIQEGRVPPLEEVLELFRRLYRPGRYGEPAHPVRLVPLRGSGEADRSPEPHHHLGA